MGPLTKFLRFTTQDEPAISLSVLAAIVLYAITRLVPGLTEDDLVILGIVVMAVLGFIVRQNVFSPRTFWSKLNQEASVAYEEGQHDAKVGVYNQDRVKGS